MADLEKISNQFSPTDFMRARRPELFSDTMVIEEPILDRNQLEFHLDTLTQRKEEIRFEHFCRRLAEKELCPNLLPQTGPTGGGDSKVDTETYPVADSISERWYEGDPERASQERWAFAFSAKKKWRPKVKDDVRKIFETTREYSLIYFISNQAIRDRDRAIVEDELRAQSGKDIRILDRSWIIEKVIQNKRWDIVYQTLDIDRPLVVSKTLLGPLDSQRQRELEELDLMIEDQERYKSSNYQLAEDCLQSALLARGLGHPRMEIDGRFDRAERIAKNRGDKRQLFRIIYQKAWTAYWWFNDFEELNSLYEIAEPLGIDSEWVWDLEKLVNLWQIGTTWRHVQRSLNDDKVWSNYTSKLRVSLSHQASNLSKPTSALWARTELSLMDLTHAAFEKTDLTSIFNEILDILREAKTHPDFPFEPVIQIGREFNRIVGGDRVYDEFFETIIGFQSERIGKSEEGRMRLERGYQKLKSGNVYDAIDQFAKAQALLAQNENKEDFIQAVTGTAFGYERAGLLWSARANLIVALDRTLYEYFKDGQIEPQALSLLRKLVWVEIQLGRVLCILAWIKLLQIFSQALDLSKTARKNFEEEFKMMDLIFGILILRTRFENWLHLDHIPGLMERYLLFMSRSASMFSLGYEDAVKFEYGQANEDLDHFFSLWLKEPAADDVPIQAEWHLDRKVVMCTILLGCKVELIADNNTNSILIGEAILAFLESFLSTAIKLKNHYAVRPQLIIEVRQFGGSEKSLTHQIEEDECGETRIIVLHSSLSCADIVQAKEYPEALFKLLADVITQLQIPFSSKSLEELFANDRAQDRAFFVAQSPLALTNLLTEDPKYHIHDWIDNSLSESFSLMRTTPWVPEIDPNPWEQAINGQFSFANGEPPEELFGIDSLKHSDFQVLSPINMALWDKARWRGMGYAFYGGNPPIPELILMFEDIESGLKIFRGWRKRLGDIDHDEWIGLTIITGIDSDHPSHYRVAISVNENYISHKLQAKNRFTMVYRMQDMTPLNNTNLERFIELYNRAGRYRLTPGLLTASQSLPHFSNDLYLEKNQLRIIAAWQIGPNDPICGALGGIDKPLIPPDVDDPPILKVLERFFKK